MKNFQMKIILWIFIVGIIIISFIGISCSNIIIKIGSGTEYLNTIMYITIFSLIIFSMVTIFIAIIQVKKYIEPMSKMLKGAKKAMFSTDINNTDIEIPEDELTESVNEIINGLKQNLKDTNSEKRQKEIILKYMTDGVVTFNMNGDVTYINPAAVQMLEIKTTDNSFKSIFSKYSDINMEKIIYLENWTSSEKKIENDKCSMNLFFIPFRDEVDMPEGVMVVIQDITEHVKIDNMRREFVADVSHELKTPITSIKGYSETLLDTECDVETEKHFLKVIDDNANRMERLVQDLLILSKYDNDKMVNKFKEFDLGELAKSCKEKFEIEIKRKNQSTQCYVTADVPLVYADKDGIERVILNILSNSIKYTQDGGKIDIYVGYVHNDAYIKIKDTGIGIPKEDLERIYERFYRVDKARSRQLGGTGLGLSIAKEIVEKNNGSIDIKSKVNEGTEVIIKIPVKKTMKEI